MKADDLRAKEALDYQTWAAIYEFVYTSSPVDVSVLKKYKAGSKETYGEVLPIFVKQLIELLEIKSTDYFFDLGAGVGNVVLQVAAQTDCHAVGVEIRKPLWTYSLQLKTELMQVLGKRLHVRFLLKDMTDVDLREATVVFANNFSFPEEENLRLMENFKNMLQKGCRVITLRDLCPRFQPHSVRFNNHPCHMFVFPWICVRTPADYVSWTSEPVEYFIYTVK